MSKKPKVLLIGLDGATWDLLKPWTREGELPAIRRLMETGVYSNLVSTIPSYTMPAWTSMITGVNPGKHGIYDLYTSSEMQRRITSSRDRKVPSIFQILSEYGRTSVAVNIPGTFPPDRIKGAMVSGLMTTPSSRSYFVYPENLKERISPFFDKAFTFENAARIARYLSTDKKAMMVRTDEIVESEAKCSQMLWEIYKPDLLWQVLRTTDLLQHYLYDSKDLESENIKCLLAHYRKVDSQIATIIEHCGGDVAVFIVSDHGFAPLRKYFHLNNWLEQMGLLKRSTKVLPLFWAVAQFADKFTDITRSKRLANNIILRMLGIRAVIDTARKVVSPNVSIDFSETKAYCPSLTSQGIKLLATDETSRDNLVKKIVPALHEVEDPETGEPVVERVFERGDIYSGSYVSQAPDLVIVTREGYIVTDMLSASGDFLCPPLSFTTAKAGDHRPKGVFIASGSGVNDKGSISPLTVYDITPAILQLIGIPVPSYMDGTLNNDVLTEDIVTRQPESETLAERTKWRIARANQ